MSREHDYEKYAYAYAQLGINKGYYLAFRDIPSIIKQLDISGRTALDYGCGTGRSTRFLKELGFDTIGVDISQSMISIAENMDPKGKYSLIESGNLPYDDEMFDLIFSSFVLIEIPSLELLNDVMADLRRVLKKDGKIIIVTSIVENVKEKWGAFTYDFKENEHPLRSGDPLKLLIYDSNIILYDYNWFEDDYYKVFDQSGLAVDERYTPLGKEDDPYTWDIESEKKYYYIYVLERKKDEGH